MIFLGSTLIRSSLQVESRGDCRANLIGFLSFRDQVLCNLQFMFEKSYFIYFAL